MKTRLPREWTKKFALRTVTTCGEYDAGSVVWFESVYKRCYPNAYDQWVIEVMSVRDYDYEEKKFQAMVNDPNRFGVDPYRNRC
jgi:hypothetical protein